MNALTTKVLLGTSLLGVTAGTIGCLAVLRRRALVGDVLAHAALPGICLAFLWLGQRQVSVLLLGGLAAGLVALLLMNLISEGTRTRPDAAIAIVLSTFFAAGVVLLSIIQRRPGGANQSGLASYIYGQAAALTRADVLLIAVVSAFALGVLGLLYKEFQLLSFDPDFALAQGWPRRGLDLTMMGTLALVTVAGLPAVGVVLMAALLIIPGAAARFWTDRLDRVLLLAGFIGGLSSFLGTAISAGWFSWGATDPAAGGRGGLPTGPMIVLSAVALFAISAVLAPERGGLARWAARVRLSRQVATQHLLRALFEASESSLPERPVVSRQKLLGQREWTLRSIGRLERPAARARWIETSPAGLRLTEAGLKRAGDLTRRHRLWELFLIHDARVAADHVDRDADATEHWLSDELVEQLERQLRQSQGAVESPIPPSPHELSPGTQPDSTS